MPYSLLTLAALTPKEYTVKIINQKQFWRKKDFAAGGIIGITCLTASSYEAYRLADKFRSSGSKVILGGHHASALPEEALEHADSVVVGEADSVWGRVIHDFENNCLKKIYKGEPLEDFFTPAYDYFLQMDPRTLAGSGICVNRGCKYHCDFCSRISNWLRFVQIEQVVGLVKKIKAGNHGFFSRRPWVTFRCDNIFSDPAYAKELFKSMIPLGIMWGSTCSIDIAFDREALDLAKASGCRQLLVGLETIHPKEYKKTSLEQVRSSEDYRIAIRNINACGIKVIGSFIIGLDSYRHRDYLSLLWFLIRSGLWLPGLSMLTPYPGTALFDQLKKEGRILSFDWRKYISLICIAKPKHISAFSVYAWFWVIRSLSVFFSPLLLLFFLSVAVSLQAAYRLSQYLVYGY